MASITLTIPEDKVNRILEAFDYVPEMGAKSAFIKKEIINLIKSKVKVSEESKREEVVTPEIDINNLDLS